MTRNNIKIKGSSGFTFVELIVVIAILLILFAIFVLNFRFLMKETDLNNNVKNIVNTLRLAQNKTLASEGASKYGVYFDKTTTPHQYTLFKGDSYLLSRDSSFDEIHKLPIFIEIYDINLSGGEEVVFDRILGTTNQPGNISLGLKDDITKTKTIYIEGSGRIGIDAPSVPADSRLIDSRHVHFSYNRIIDTASEKLILTFEGGTTKNIILADNLEDGQIYWEGEVDVGGETQKIKIHTHRLNSPDTLFSVNRDRSKNNKSLEIKISGDESGSLISYTADGQESRGTSIFLAAGEAGDPQRQ